MQRGAALPIKIVYKVSMVQKRLYLKLINQPIHEPKEKLKSVASQSHDSEEELPKCLCPTESYATSLRFLWCASNTVYRVDYPSTMHQQGSKYAIYLLLFLQCKTINLFKIW